MTKIDIDSDQPQTIEVAEISGCKILISGDNGFDLFMASKTLEEILEKHFIFKVKK